MGASVLSGGSGGDGCGGGGMGTNSEFERLRVLVWNLTSYSNIQIVKIAKGFVEIDKESSTLVGVSHKAYLDCLEGCSQAGESRRCLALLYVCNEILVLVPGDESWQVLLAQAMSKYVPLICSLALRQQESNVVLNVMRLPVVWKQQEVFSADLCDQMKAQCEVYQRSFVDRQREQLQQQWVAHANVRGDAMATAGWASTARGSPGIRSWAGDGRDRIDEWMDLPEDDRMVGGGGGGSADGRDGVADDTVSGPVMEEDIDFLSSLVGADVAGISAHAGAGGARGNPPGKGG
eukprot:CAMPEP_0179470068 /NCGR_PEP_ID=MMETSP0799-20121207/50591_1 /TAXON_ID=46947 /ORGANISM="Geminigera cryophila, Strain CCMP2564" /LENGTH=290 /DNA_ID=CAMNT_0021276895 /DNA_START=457 /DNA_END=1326 /DNA_ORIENTATION=+